MKVEALVVDDSMVFRKNIARALESTCLFSHIDTAGDGKQALSMSRKKHYQVITLDVEMPLMNGLEALEMILKEHPETIVLMISNTTKKGAANTIEALHLGARDFILKDHAYGLGKKQSLGFRKNVAMKVKALVERYPLKQNIDYPIKTTPKKLKEVNKKDISLCLIGSSTGGPSALEDLFSSIHKELNYSIVIVQHMPALFTSKLAERLNLHTSLQVVEAEDEMVLKENLVVIAPGGKQLKMLKRRKKWVCKITDDDPVQYAKPSVDYTFASVAEQDQNDGVLAIILTGMGKDGVDGCSALKEKGAAILTQTQESCVVYGMPKAVDEQNLSMVSADPEDLMGIAHELMNKPYLD